MLEITGIFPESRKEEEKKPTRCTLLQGFNSQDLPSITWWYRAPHSVEGTHGPQEPELFMWRRCEGGAGVLWSKESMWPQGRTHVPDKCSMHGALTAGGGDESCTACPVSGRTWGKRHLRSLLSLSVTQQVTENLRELLSYFGKKIHWF